MLLLEIAYWLFISFGITRLIYCIWEDYRFEKTKIKIPKLKPIIEGRNKSPSFDFHSLVEITHEEENQRLRIEIPGRPGRFHLVGNDPEKLKEVKEFLQEYCKAEFKYLDDWLGGLALKLFYTGIRCQELDELALETRTRVNQTLQISDSNPYGIRRNWPKRSDRDIEREIDNVSYYLPDFVHLMTWFKSFSPEVPEASESVENDFVLTGVYFMILSARSNTFRMFKSHSMVFYCEQLVSSGYLEDLNDTELEERLNYITDFQLGKLSEINLGKEESDPYLMRRFYLEEILTNPEKKRKASIILDHERVYRAIPNKLGLENSEIMMNHWKYSSQTAGFIVESIKRLGAVEKSLRNVIGENDIKIECNKKEGCKFHELNLSETYKWGMLPPLPAHPGCSCSYAKNTTDTN